MQIDFIDDHPWLCRLQEQWEAVYQADPEAHFFTSWTWMSKRLQDLDSPWFVLAARPEGDDENYVAFFPLTVQIKAMKGKGLFDEIQVPGHATFERAGLICRPEYEDRAIPGFASYLANVHWASLLLTYFATSDRRFQLLLDGFSEQEFAIRAPDVEAGDTRIDHRFCLSIHLPDSWDTYLATKLSHKTRKNVRNFLRKVESGDRFHITYTDAHTIDRDLDILFRFWTLRWGGLYGRQVAVMVDADRAMIRHCFDEGLLYMPVLWEGDRPLGALATITDHRHKSLLFKTIARDETFQNPSPGLILLAHTVRHAISEGFEICDFLQGNHGYKYSLGVDETELKHRAVRRRRALKLDDCLDKRWLNWAFAGANQLRDTDQQDDAIRAYRQIIAIDPHHSGARNALAGQLSKKGHHAAAKRALERPSASVSEKPARPRRTGRRHTKNRKP